MRDFPPLQPASASPQQGAAGFDPFLPQEEPASQTNTTTGSDLTYKLLAKSRLDEIIHQGGPATPTSADGSATLAMNEDLLRVLETMLKDNQSDKEGPRLDSRQESALRTAVDGIRELRILLCISDYTQKVCKCIQNAYKQGRKRAQGRSVHWLCENLSPEKLEECIDYIKKRYPGINIITRLPISHCDFRLYWEKKRHSSFQLREYWGKRWSARN
jgi:hypothetical protein